MKKVELSDFIRYELGRYEAYISSAQIYVSLDQAKESIEPLGELDAYSASVTTAHTYTMPSTVYFVEGVFIEPSAGGGNTKQMPPSLWAFDHVDMTLTLLQTPSTSDTLWVVYRNKYDWVSPTWLPAEHSYTSYLLCPAATASTASGAGFLQALTTAASSATVYAVRYNAGLVSTSPESWVLTTKLYYGTTTSALSSMVKAVDPIQALGLGSEHHTVSFPNTVTFQAGVTYWLEVSAEYSPAGTHPSTSVWRTTIDSAATGYGASYLMGNSGGSYAITSGYFPWQYKTVEESVEVDPEYVRQYALFLLYSQLGMRLGKKDLYVVADGYYQKATLRKDYLFRRKNLESVIEERRQLKLGG